MVRSRFIPTQTAILLALGLLAGCSPLNVNSAREVSRERLLVLSEQGRNDHLRYVGSDTKYHYVFDSRPESERMYKIRSNEIKLQDTFRPGDEEPYVLWPQVIEGKLLGEKPREELHGPKQTPTGELDLGEGSETTPGSASTRQP